MKSMKPPSFWASPYFYRWCVFSGLALIFSLYLLITSMTESNILLMIMTGFMCIISPIILLGALAGGYFGGKVSRVYKYVNVEDFRSSLVSTMLSVGFDVKHTSNISVDNLAHPGAGTLVFGYRLAKVVAELNSDSAHILGPRSVINQLKLPVFRIVSGDEAGKEAVKQRIVDVFDNFAAVLLKPITIPIPDTVEITGRIRCHGCHLVFPFEQHTLIGSGLVGGNVACPCGSEINFLVASGSQGYDQFVVVSPFTSLAGQQVSPIGLWVDKIMTQEKAVEATTSLADLGYSLPKEMVAEYIKLLNSSNWRDWEKACKALAEMRLNSAIPTIARLVERERMEKELSMSVNLPWGPFSLLEALQLYTGSKRYRLLQRQFSFMTNAVVMFINGQRMPRQACKSYKVK